MEIYEIIASMKKVTFKEVVKGMQNPPSERTIRGDLVLLKNNGLVDFTGRGRGAVCRRFHETRRGFPTASSHHGWPRSTGC